MKRGKKLLLLLAALAVMAGAFWGVSKLTAGDPIPEGTNTQQVIFSAAADTVRKLEWTYGDSSFALEKKDTGWIYSLDAALPLDQSCPEAILEGLAEVKSFKVIEAPEDTQAFGLTEPTCTITVTTDTVTTLTLGGETVLGGQYYLSKGDGNVYLVDATFLSPYNTVLMDMVQKETLPDLSEVTALSVTKEAGSFALTYQEGSGLSYSDHYVWFTDGAARDTEAVEALLKKLDNLRWVDCVSYNATSDELASWGLEKPAAVYEVAYGATQAQEAGTLSIAFGDGSEDGEAVYARLTGSNMVYLVDIDVAQVLIDATAEDLGVNDILRLDAQTVTSVDIALDGASYTVNRTVTETTDANGQTVSKALWMLGDKEIALDTVLDSLNTLEGTNTGSPFTPELGSELTLVFHRDTQTHPRVELVFYRYDSTNCLVSLNGSNDILLARTEVVTLKEAINALVLG